MRPTGPIEMSPGLARALSVCRALRDQAREDGKQQLAAELTPKSKPELDAAGIVRVEEGIGLKLPDDVVAIAALGVPALEVGLGLTLDAIYDTPERMEELGIDVPRGWCCVASVARDPFAARRGAPAEDSPDMYFCLRRTAKRDVEPTVLVIDPTADERRVPLSELVREQLTLGYREQLNVPVAVKHSGPLGRDPEWAPAIVGPPEAEQPRPRVEHPKFGAGTVMRVEGDGESRKLEIDFDDHGRKVLLARFVSELR